MNMYFKGKRKYYFDESVYIEYMKMAGAYDTEQQRITDQVRCTTFREARGVRASFINRE